MSMNHALRAWPSLCKSLGEYKYIALFLDYDGTLTPIASRPELAILSRKTRGLIESLKASKRFAICIISGRSLTDLEARVGVEGITYVGNHGLELEGPGMSFISAKARESRLLLKRIYKELDTSLKPVTGAIVEDKGLSLTLHYRLVKKKDIPTVKALFDEVVKPYCSRKEVRVGSGKRVFEVGPFTGWDKGKAALWVLRRFKECLKTDSIFPVYIGDDWTDESAFKALRDKGVPIFVGGANPDTTAQLFLKTPKEVGKLLERLARTFG